MPTVINLSIYILIFMFGIVIGSFLNVCILRIPTHESIIPSSHCTSCGHILRWYDLFPLFSFLFLGGRCRYCKAKISPQYPIIEALNGILYVIVFMANDFTITSIIYCLLASALIVLSVIDFRTYEIPIGCNYFIAGLGIVMCAIDFENFLSHLLGAVVVSGLLYLIYLASKRRAIGGGDIKLMATAGLVLGVQNIILAFFAGCIIGAVVHTIRMKLSDADHVLAMGPYLSMGIYLCMLWGDSFINWYMGLVM